MIKLARMDGEWFFSEDGKEWHIMICAEIDYLVASRGTEYCQVLYFPPLGNSSEDQTIEDKSGYNETVAYGLSLRQR